MKNYWLEKPIHIEQDICQEQIDTFIATIGELYQLMSRDCQIQIRMMKAIESNKRIFLGGVQLTQAELDNAPRGFWTNLKKGIYGRQAGLLEE